MVDDAGDCDGAGEKSKGVKVSILFFENSALKSPLPVVPLLILIRRVSIPHTLFQKWIVLNEK